MLGSRGEEETRKQRGFLPLPKGFRDFFCSETKPKVGEMGHKQGLSGKLKGKALFPAKPSSSQRGFRDAPSQMGAGGTSLAAQGTRERVGGGGARPDSMDICVP